MFWGGLLALGFPLTLSGPGAGLSLSRRWRERELSGFELYKKKEANYYNLKAVARKLRQDATPQEKALWEKLRDRQLAGLKFRKAASDWGLYC